MKIFRYESTDSTNERAKFFAATSREDAVFVAGQQTAGRGRRGRTFVSPPGAGLYVTFLKHPSGFDPVGTTVFAAVALCRAIERVSSARPQIKWVNDLYLGGKKIAGILAEGKAGETDGYLLIGLGVNLLRAPMPPELKGIAGSIEEATGERILPGVLEEALIEEMEKGPDESVTEEYRRRSFLLGKNVTVYRIGREPYEGKAIGISDTGCLILRFPDGTTEELMTGEVSVRETGKDNHHEV